MEQGTKASFTSTVYKTEKNSQPHRFASNFVIVYFKNLTDCDKINNSRTRKKEIKDRATINFLFLSSFPGALSTI